MRVSKKIVNLPHTTNENTVKKMSDKIKETESKHRKIERIKWKCLRYANIFRAKGNWSMYYHFATRFLKLENAEQKIA